MNIRLVILFLLWRLYLFLVSYISPSLINFAGTFPYFKERLIDSNLPHFIWAFGSFDGVHYLGIAKDLYAYQYTQAFFPICPLLIKIFSIFTFGNLLLSALIISNIAFLAAILIFHKLMLKIYDKKIAFWSCIFLLSFPTSFYFGSIYTEGLFFLMIISSFYYLEKKNFLLASVIGTFASATRLTGLFLFPAFVFSKEKRRWPFLFIPLGLIVYMLYLKLEFNNPLYFLTSQSIFGQERSVGSFILLPQVFYRYLKILLTTSGQPYINALFELSSTIFAIFALLLSIKIVKREWLIFSAIAVLVPTLTGTFASMPRYILLAFPIYIYLAHIKSDKIKLAIAFVFICILFITTTYFSQGYWVA